jgi:hypothetical protein
MASGMLGRRIEACRRRRDLNQVAPPGLVGSAAPSGSPSRVSICDWLWPTSAAATARVEIDVGGLPSTGLRQARPVQVPAVALPSVLDRPGTEVVAHPLPEASGCFTGPPIDDEMGVVTRHDLPDEIALILHTTAGDVRCASIQDLELLCRARGSSLLVVVTRAESALQRCQQNRDRHVQSLGDDDEVLDGPTGPAA